MKHEEDAIEIVYDENTDVVTVRLLEAPEGSIVMREDSEYDCILYAIDEENNRLVGLQIYSFRALRRHLLMQHLWKNKILLRVNGIKRWVYELIKEYKNTNKVGGAHKSALEHI